MKAVARLMLTYFTGTPGSKWLTISGLLLLMASLYVVLYLPQTEHMLAFAWPGVVTFFLGSHLMPLTFGRLAQGRSASTLPGARVKLLASAILSVLLVALPVGLLTPLAYVAGMSTDVGQLRENPHLLGYTLWLAVYTYTSACIAAAWLYVLIWFVTRERGVAGFAKAMVVLLVLLLISGDPEQAEGPQIWSNLLQLGAFALVFSAGFLCWPRLKRWQAGRRRRPDKHAGFSAREFAGREVDLMLGNTRPWILIGSLLLLPMAATLLMGVGGPAFWLLYLSVASIIAGGGTERAPGRSRALWLRGDWSRTALFDAVEKSAWRHNGLVMFALLLLLLGLGSYTDMPAVQLASGVPLIVLGTTLSTYLGLALTRGVRVPEAFAGVLVMLAMMIIAFIAIDDGLPRWVVAASLSVLAAAALLLRSVARRRWSRIDWSQCRRESPALRAG
jgi:hypothetical protein